MKISKKSLFIFLLPIAVFSFAANPDTIPPLSSEQTFIKKYSDFSFSQANNYFEKVDTSLFYFHRYNPAYSQFHYTLGNIGLAHHSFIFQPDLTTGFKFKPQNYSFWELSKENIFYYNTRVPYTEVNLVLGSKEEQYFRGLHTQNITSNWNFGFQFNKIKSVGFYPAQRSDVTNAAIQTNYLSNSNKYGILANAFYNNLTVEENGGLVNEDSINTDEFANISRLNSAQSRRNSRGFNVKQYFNSSSLIDSIPDSDTSFAYVYKVNRGFSHAFSYEDYRVIFNETNPLQNFYPAIFFDSIVTFDSIPAQTIENEIAWSNYNNSVRYSFSIQQQYAQIFYNQINRNFYLSNYFIKSQFSSNKRTSFFWNINSSYIFAGNNKNDYNINAQINYKAGNNHVFNLNLLALNASPSFLHNKYYSNHFIWENDLSKTQNLLSGFSYSNTKINLKCSIQGSLLNNYIFFNAQAVPQQSEIPVFIYTGTVEKIFKWKQFNFLTELIYQQVSRPDIIRVPDLIARNALFYEFRFAKKLKLHIGFEGFYFTRFFNYRYMPVAGQFFLQDEQLQGNYPFIDFFANMKIKQVRIFFKIDHLSEGMSERDYFILPAYPYSQRAFKVGVSWVFYN